MSLPVVSHNSMRQIVASGHTHTLRLFVDIAAVCLQGSSTPQGMMIVPQKLYMVLGSLRQQLLYPAFTGAIIEEALVTYDKHEGGPLSIVDEPLAGVAGFSGKDAAAANVLANGTAAVSDDPLHPAPVTPTDEELAGVLRQVRSRLSESDSDQLLDTVTQDLKVAILFDTRRNQCDNQPLLMDLDTSDAR
jgi:hypothetical protein